MAIKATRQKKAVTKKASTKKSAKKSSGTRRRIVLTEVGLLSSSPINVSMKFLLGGGDVTIVHSSGGVQVDRQPLKKTGTVIFDNAIKGDVITVNGTCSGSAELSTDRTSLPATDPSGPIKYTKNISQILRIK